MNSESTNTNVSELKSSVYMYFWNSEALSDYALGTIIVLASSVQEAREKAKKEAMFAAYRHRKYWFESSVGGEGLQVLAHFREDYQDFAATLDKDLQREPFWQTASAYFITGAE